MKYVKSFEDFLNEQSYDESDSVPKASYRSEDYSAKDELRTTAVVIDDLLRLIEDGEQLEESQLKVIKDVYNNINSLKMQLEGKQKAEEEQAEALKKEQDVTNNQ